MSRLRLVMVAALAVFAVSAIGVSTASAAAKPPEFKSASEVCVKIATKTGRYTNSTCTTESATHEGEFDLIPTKHKFTDVSGISKLYGEGEIVITCQKDKSSGEITGAKTVGSVKVTFEECKGKKKTEECVVNGGTITTETLSGGLGKVAADEAPKEVGEDLKPPSGKAFVELSGSCIPTTKVTGSVIGEVTPVGPPAVLKGDLVFKCFSTIPPVQEIEKIEGVKDTLTAFGAEACFESTDVVTFEEAIEVT